MKTTILGAAALAVALVACGGHDDAGDAARSTADSITKAVYGDDVDSVQSSMDDALKPKVTRASVGTLSDKMHRLGAYMGLTLLSTDATKDEYTYKASFEKGTMNVVVRLDKDGKAAAYRVLPAR